jgi:hypothetical protein
MTEPTNGKRKYKVVVERAIGKHLHIREHEVSAKTEGMAILKALEEDDKASHLAGEKPALTKRMFAEKVKRKPCRT